MNSSPKILVFATQHMPAGGIESHLQEFCRQLSASGVSIDLIITDSRMDQQTEDFFRKNCNRVFLGRCGKSSFRAWWLLMAGLRIWPFRYTAVYTNGQGESIIRIKKMVRANSWIHHHHTSGDEADRETWGKQYLRALNSADRVIACSKHNAGMMQSFLGREITVIPCFSRKISLASQSRGKEKKIRFGYYGRLIPEKGIDLICRLSEDPDCRLLEFHIWGEGEAYPAPYFDRYPNLHYHKGFRGLSQLSAVLGSIDGFLLLSSHPEGLPVCLLEVMSAGIPWIATDRGGVRDIACDPPETRIISRHDGYPEIRKAVLKMADDIRSGRLSGKRQMAWYDEAFSAPRITGRWLSCLGIN